MRNGAVSGVVLTVEQMRAAERATMDAGTGEWELMQRAGEGAARWVARMAAGRAVCVLCGPGNNGGDGYVIAEALRRRGGEVRVIAPKPPGSETAKTARAEFGGDVESGSLPAVPVYVDCLFGYGLSRKVEGEYAALLDELAAANGFKIAVDVPSSIASDSGESLGPDVRYDLTLALGAWKRAHFVMPAMARMGIRRPVDIGLEYPAGVPQLSVPPKIERPAPDAHKYRRGLLAIVAGEMPGAPLLAAEAAMRSGAGYVKLLSQHSHPDAPAELVVVRGKLSDALADERLSALLVGPGLGKGDSARSRLESTIAAGRPTVIDADALHLLDPAMMEGVDGSRIAVTPHEGELEQLCKAFEVKAEGKIGRAEALHDRTKITVLAKGPDTVLAGKNELRFFERGSSWLSTAGTGDVLAGIAASRLAVHGQILPALEEAVWIQHEAARLAGTAFTAGQLAHAVKPAMQVFL